MHKVKSHSQTLSKRIRQARLASEMSQSELARLLGIKPQAVQHWERGISNPKTNRLSALALALGIEVSWLLDGEQIKNLVHEPMLSEYGELNPSEKILINIFQNMDDDQKNAFTEMGKMLIKNNKPLL